MKEITLIVTDQNDCSDTINGEIYINNLPTVSFEWSNVCAGQPIEFINSSSGNDNPISLNNWYLSDSYTTTYSSFSHTYTSINDYKGSYVDAELTVTDQANCSSSLTANNLIEIHPLPTIDFTTTDPCEGGYFVFTNTSSVDNSIFNDNLEASNSPNTQTWIYNSVLASANQPWTFTPNDSPGIYQVSLRQESSFISEYNNQHCSSKVPTQNVEILVMPKITFNESFNPQDQCGENVNYILDATHDEVNKWSYIIDDSPTYSNSTTEDIEYEFERPGIYNLMININNNNGCNDSIEKDISIYPDPLADFTVDINELCEGLPIIFTDKSTIPNNPLYDNASYISEWYWDYKDLTSNYNYTVFILSHEKVYNTINGDFTPFQPVLTVTTDKNCISEYELSGNINIYPSPKAVLEVSPLEGPGLYQFDGSLSSTGNPPLPASPSLYNYIFTTSERVLSEQEDVIEYQFSSNTNHQNGFHYDVYLEVINEESLLGCSSIDSVPGVYVDYFKGLFVPSALAPNAIGGEAAIFKPKGKSLQDYQLQIFDKFGNLLWETDKLDEDGKPLIGWNGTDLNGIALPQGTYIWKIHATFSDGSTWEGMEYKDSNTKVKEGAVYLIR